MLDNNMHYLSSRWWPPKPPLPLPIPCVSALWYETRTRIQASVRWRYTAVRWSSRRQTWLCCYWWNSGGTWSDRLEREPMTSQRSGHCVQLRKSNIFGFVSWWEEMQANGQKQNKCDFVCLFKSGSNYTTCFFSVWFFKEIHTFIQQCCLKLIKSDSNKIYNATKYLYLK